jgi:1-deoxy-D-xylulose-5-phosphate synthase
LPNYPVVCTIEDHSLNGGFGSAVVEFANEQGLQLQASIKRMGVRDEFVPHGTQAEQYSMNGYDVKSIMEYVCTHVKANKLVA